MKKIFTILPLIFSFLISSADIQKKDIKKLDITRLFASIAESNNTIQDKYIQSASKDKYFLKGVYENYLNKHKAPEKYGNILIGNKKDSLEAFALSKNPLSAFFTLMICEDARSKNLDKKFRPSAENILINQNYCIGYYKKAERLKDAKKYSKSFSVLNKGLNNHCKTGNGGGWVLERMKVLKNLNKAYILREKKK